MSEHEIWLTEPDGIPIQVLQGFTYLRYTRVVNGIGSFEIVMPGDFDWSVLDTDRLIEIWRAPPGGNLKWQMTGFLRKWGISRKKGITKTFLKGPGQADLLNRRIIAYDGTTSQAKKTGAADDVMKEFVDEALGSSAGNDPYGRSRILSSFTIAADVGEGPTYDGEHQYQALLDVLHDISDNAHAKGTPIYYDVVQTSPANFEFRTYVNQRGLDRTSGPQAITFGLEMGNLADPSWEEDWSDERNVIYGLGQGEGTDRTIDPEKDVGRIYRTPWNRQEASQDARG